MSSATEVLNLEMNIIVGNSPVAQCWDPYAFTAEGLGATSSRGPKIPQAWRHSPKKMYLLRVNLNLHGHVWPVAPQPAQV